MRFSAKKLAVQVAKHRAASEESARRKAILQGCLLSQPFDYFLELHQIIELLYPIQLESDQLISAKPAPHADFEHGVIQLYRNAKREGVLV